MPFCHSSRRKPGFTLIELLVAMAVVLILMSVLLPAVQMCREAARRRSCQNNLMQLGISAHSYMMAHGVLPSGCVNRSGPIDNRAVTGLHISWTLQLLPHLGEVPAWRKVNFDESVYSASHAPLRDHAISTLQCPSAAGQRITAPLFSRLPGSLVNTNYAGSSNGGAAPIDVDNNGLLFLNSAVRSVDIRDGLSNTILFGEKPTDADELSWMSGTRATLRCLSSTIAPTPPQPGAAGTEVGMFGSSHPGVVNYCLADGSVTAFAAINGFSLEEMGNRYDGELVDAEFEF